MKTNILPKTIKQSLICTLTETERREYGIHLATTLGDIDEIEAEKKRTVDHFKDRIAGLQARADDLSRKVRDGKEWRNVECQVILGSPDKEHKQIVRLDTHEVVKTELMTEHDLQVRMSFVDDDDETSEGETSEHDDGNVIEVPALPMHDNEDTDTDDDEPQDGPTIIDADSEPSGKKYVNASEVLALSQFLVGKATAAEKNEALITFANDYGLHGLQMLAAGISNKLSKELREMLQSLIANYTDRPNPEY